jgi:hypothetical protein
MVSPQEVIIQPASLALRSSSFALNTAPPAAPAFAATVQPVLSLACVEGVDPDDNTPAFIEVCMDAAHSALNPLIMGHYPYDVNAQPNTGDIDKLPKLKKQIKTALDDLN